MGTAPRASPPQWIRFAFAHPTWSRSSTRVGVFDRRMGKAERAHRCPATPFNRVGLWRSMGTAPRASPPQWIRLAFAHPTWSRIIGVARCVDRRMGKAERAHRCPATPFNRVICGVRWARRQGRRHPNGFGLPLPILHGLAHRRGSVCLVVGWAKRSVPIVGWHLYSTGWACGVRWARRQGRRHLNGFGLPLPILHGRGLSVRLGVLTVGWAKRSVPIVARHLDSTGWAGGVRWARRQGRRHLNGFGLPLPILHGRGLSARLGVFDRRMGKAERAHRWLAPRFNRVGLWRSMGTAPRASPPQWIRFAFAHPTWSRIIGAARCVDRRMGKAKRAHRCPKIPQHRSLAGLPGKPKKPPAQPGAFFT
ncbi:hypothetical protein MSL71_45120 [Desulfoluna butyratoxydans]|uniref:Uncharacterized protein n=1 Tax=Desulfoluna butyratoxydans TaxID=231438 RepID=A0A4U8YRB7_9BACT|nr:hypothetical protein MSL71_45120 [Desulfoluna butyratoxydans]